MMIRLSWEFGRGIHSTIVSFEKEYWEWIYDTVGYTLEYPE